MLIELSEDQVIDALITELKISLDYFECEYEKRANGHESEVFDTDRKEDLKAIKQHIEACKLLLKYYGVKV